MKSDGRKRLFHSTGSFYFKFLIIFWCSKSLIIVIDEIMRDKKVEKFIKGEEKDSEKGLNLSLLKIMFRKMFLKRMVLFLPINILKVIQGGDIMADKILPIKLRD